MNLEHNMRSVKHGYRDNGLQTWRLEDSIICGHYNRLFLFARTVIIKESSEFTE